MAVVVQVIKALVFEVVEVAEVAVEESIVERVKGMAAVLRRYRS